MTRYLCINENNILKSISDKLYVYKFDPNESGISIDKNTKLVTIGTHTIQYYSDLPMSMTERCDHTLITLSGTFELKPRIEINGVYYYRKYEKRDLDPSQSELYNDRSTGNKYIYNEPNAKQLELIIGRLLFTQFNSFTHGIINPSTGVSYYDRATEMYYQYDDNLLALVPINEPPVGIEVDKGYCINPGFYVENSRVDSSDRFLYEELDKNIFYIYDKDFELVTPVEEQKVDGSKKEVYYNTDMDYYLYTPDQYIQCTTLEGEYSNGSIHNTWSSEIDPDPSYVYYDPNKDTYYRFQKDGYCESYIVSCYMSDNKIYYDQELTQEINPKEDIPYHDLISSFYYRWRDIPNRIIPCHEGYKDENNFYDSLHSIYVPVDGDIYKDTSADRYYMYGGTHYSQIHITLGYLHEGKLYSDPNLLNEIDMVDGTIYCDRLSDTYFRYNSYQWTRLTIVEGYLSNGNFYDLNGSFIPKNNNYLYSYNDDYYLYCVDKYLELKVVNCYYSDNKLVKNLPDPTFLFSCIISDQCIEPEYKVMETGEYCIVPPGMNIDDYIKFINQSSSTIFLNKSGNDEDYLQVANIFGINLNDTTFIHHFNDISPYGRDNKVLLDEKMQIATWVRTLRDKYPSLVFYTDPNDRGKISTHTNEFIYYQAKLFSDDSQYTTPLRYRDYRYGRVRNYEISIFVRYESPDMVTFLNRRNEFLMHEFLNPVQDIELNLENGDIIHIGVNWTRSIREEDPDKNVDASERNVYTFITQCNLNGLLLEKSDVPTSIEEVITSIYTTSNTVR